MVGPADISVILSQAGRIEKVGQSPLAHSEVSRQILTENEAQERLRKRREVNKPKKGDEISTRERIKDNEHRKKKRNNKGNDSSTEDKDQEEKYIIDVVV